MTITIKPPLTPMTGLDYGEFTPQAKVEGGARPWPISRAAQQPLVRNYLSRALAESGADRTTGLTVLVHWNGRHNADTLVQICDRTYTSDVGDSTFTGEHLDEYNLDGTLREKRSHEDDVQDVRMLHLEYGIRPMDRPPQAPVPERSGE